MEYNSNSIINTNNIYQEKKYFTYYQEYYLINENIVYKIIIDKNNEEVFIKCKNYSISLNNKNLSSLIKMKINSTTKAYEFIFNMFEENKVAFKNIIINKEIIFLLKNNEREIELVLKKKLII